MIIETHPETFKCTKPKLIAQLSNYGRSYLNKSHGNATYFGTFLLISVNDIEIDIEKVTIWAAKNFKNFAISQQIDDSVKITVKTYRGGSGYNVWQYALNELASVLNAKINLEYIN